MQRNNPAPKYVVGDNYKIRVSINLVFDHFNDLDKTTLWFKTRNPMLGNVSPSDMIKEGRIDKVLDFIDVSLDENKMKYTKKGV